MKKLLLLFFICFVASANAQVFKVTNEGLILVADSVSGKKITELVFANFKGPLLYTLKFDKSWISKNAGKYYCPIIENDSLIVAQTNKGWGCISKRGKIIFDFKFSEPLYFFDKANYFGYLRSVPNEMEGYDRDFPVSDRKGNVIARYGRMVDHSGDIFLMAGMGSDKYGIVSSHLDTLLPFEFKCTSWDDKNFSFSKKGFLALKNKEEKCGVINNKGATVIPFEYDYIDDVVFDVNEVIKDGHSGLLDANLKWIVPLEYEKIKNNYNIDGPVAALLFKGGKWSVLDSNFQIQKEQFDGYYIYFDDQANMLVNVNGKYGIYNVRSKTFSIPLKYDSILKYPVEEDHFPDPTNNHILTIQGNQYCFYNSRFQKIYETEAAKIEPANCSDYLVIEKDQKKYLMKDNGKIIAGPYDAMQCAIPFKQNYNVSCPYFMVKKDNKYGWIGTDGNIVVPIDYDDVCTSRVKDDAEGNHGFTFVMLKKDTIYYFDKTGKSLGTKRCEKKDNFCNQN